MAGYVYTNENCIGCNRCISVCPILTANQAVVVDGKSRIEVNHAQCINCGACFDACEHQAREYADDTEQFFADLQRGESISLLLAPAFLANYPKEYQRVLGYLKSKGVSHIKLHQHGTCHPQWSQRKRKRCALCAGHGRGRGKENCRNPRSGTEFDIMFGKGISREGDLIDLAVKVDAVQKSGAWYAYKGEKIGQGRENAKTFLREHPEIMAEVEVSGRHPKHPEIVLENPSTARDPCSSSILMSRSKDPLHTAVVAPVVSAAETRKTIAIVKNAPRSNTGV